MLALIQQDSNPSIASINRKIDLIAGLSADGTWPQLYFSIVIFLIVAAIAALFIGASIDSITDNIDPSFVLLTKKSYKIRDLALQKLQRQWYTFVFTVIGSIIVGVISNIVRTYAVDSDSEGSETCRV